MGRIVVFYLDEQVKEFIPTQSLQKYHFCFSDTNKFASKSRWKVWGFNFLSMHIAEMKASSKIRKIDRVVYYEWMKMKLK